MNTRSLKILAKFLTRNKRASYLSCLILASLLYIRQNQRDPLVLYYHPQSAIMLKAIRNSKLSELAFYPSLLMPNGNQQTFYNPIMGKILKAQKPIEFQREIFRYHDEGSIALDWVDYIPEKGTKRKPILAIMPGLSSDNDEVYVLNLLIEAKKHGYHAVVINYRGASNHPLTSPLLYCAGSVNDLRHPLEYIYENYCCDSERRVNDLFLVGNSMGANIVASYLGEEGPNCFVKAACCVQPPLKMWVSGENIEKRLFGFYNYVLGKNLKVKLGKYAPAIQEQYLIKYGVDVTQALEKCKNLVEIDTHITSICFGYGDLKNYYDQASCIHRLPLIKTPTFILMAKDDPIIGEKAIDYDACMRNPYLLLGVTNKGGHLGFFESYYSCKQWFTIPVFEYLQQFKQK